MSSGIVNVLYPSDPNRFGMILFLSSEGTFFAFLITAYIYFHGVTQNYITTGPTAKNSLDPILTGIFSVLLISSSFTMRKAEKFQRAGEHRRFRNWLIATFALGFIFLIGQAHEYLGLYAKDVTISRNIFGSTFFTLTGFHALHVTLGLVVLLITIALAIKGAFQNSGTSAVATFAIYWHFVDWVWVVIFSIVYIWPRFY